MVLTLVCLWCLTPLLAIFQLYIVAVSFVGGGNQSTRRKPPSCHKSLTNFYHIMLYTSPWSGFEPTTSVVIGTDCIDSCKSNYHTITATMSPLTLEICSHMSTFQLLFPLFLSMVGGTWEMKKWQQKPLRNRWLMMNGRKFMRWV